MLKDHIIDGCPSYSAFKDELAVGAELAMKSKRFTMPEELQQQTLE